MTVLRRAQIYGIDRKFWKQVASQAITKAGASRKGGVLGIARVVGIQVARQACDVPPVLRP